MSNQELLHEISVMLDEKLEEKLEQKLEEKLEQKLDEKLEEKLDNKLDTRLAVALNPIKEDLSDLKMRVKKLEVTQENQIIPLLKDITSCYTDTFKRYQKDADKMEQTFEDVAALKQTVEKHSAILQNSFA